MKPILFNTKMVKAILDGRKTQTRRPIKLNIKKDVESYSLNGAVFTIDSKFYFEHNLIENFSKYKVGDILYVRETWCYGSVVGDSDEHGNEELWLEQLQEHEDNEIVFYKADMDEALNQGVSFDEVVWKPAIHMPKKYARIFLKVVNVRVERLQDIGYEDIYKDGISEINDCEMSYKCDAYIGYDKEEKAIESFKIFWDSTAKDGYKYLDNPYIFVYIFEVIDKKDI